MASVFRVPKPRSILRVISLRTAAEFIAFTLLINKVTGFYGILAIFTGYHLNPLQLSHYIYSVIVLALAGWLSTSIKPPAGGIPVETALKNMALAWVYILDTVINGVYTMLFGMGWFVLLAQKHGLVEEGKGAPGKETMDETAGFTSPAVNASSVGVVAKPAPGLMPGQEAVAIPTGQGSSFGAAVMESDSITSIALLAMFWLVRVYFCLLMLSYARTILRHYIVTSSTTNTNPFAQDSATDADPTMAPNPFVNGGAVPGWQGALGRTMIRFPTTRYWLGREETSSTGLSDWERATSGRFESGRKVLHIRVPSDRGVAERERRARSGTGPPAKMVPPS